MTTRGLTFLWAFVLASGVQSVFAQSTVRLPSHLIVLRKAVDALPADLAPLFQANVEPLHRFVDEPADVWPRDKRLRLRNRWHHIDADVTAAARDGDAGIEAARAFPRDKAAAQRLYRKLGRHRGGFLPWAVEECFQELVVAFRSGAREDVLAWAGYLIHFAADAADPFRCSARAFADGIAGPTFGHSRGPHPHAHSHSVSERWSMGLLARRTWEYAADITLTAADCEPAMEPVNATFAAVVEALASLDEVGAADRAILERLGVTDRPSFDARQEAYYEALHARCGGVCRDRLRAGARLAARLIAGAWQSAGHPGLESIVARSAADSGSAPPPLKSARSAPIVGSRHSVVFHKPDCPFAGQIAEENLVGFRSALEARRQGRRACKHCRPE